MHRIQVQLTDEQETALREMARLRGASLSALIREGVDQVLEPQKRAREDKRKRALEMIGMFGSAGPGDLSESHDKYFADAILDRIEGKRT